MSKSGGNGLFARSTMKRRKRHCLQLFLLLSGVLLCTTGILIFIFFDNIYEFILKESLKFTPTSKSYQAWRTNDPPLDMDIYVFNWTNAHDARNPEVKPKFQEVGPYRFKEVKEKINVTWNTNNKTVSYRHMKFYYFDKPNSVRDLTDNITTINAVPLTVAYKSRDLPYFTIKALSFILSGISRLAVTSTARQFLFDGYQENILSILSLLPMLKVNDKFGIFYGKNATISQDGIFSMSYETDENFGQIVWWNYKNRTDFYEGRCSALKGSAGEFHPFYRKRDKLILFSSELCKFAEMEYVEDVVIKGVKGYKYTGDNIFDNGTKRPENNCFCKGDCIPSGVMNVSACRDGSPSFLSMPHFYGADPYYTDIIEGMKPEKDKHEFYIVLEPNSGIVMEIGARMQVNMLVQPIRGISFYSTVRKAFHPLFYFTQKIELKDDLAENLRLIQNLPEYGNYACLILGSLGILLILWGISSIFCCAEIKKEASQNGEINKDIKAEEIPLNEKK